MFKVQKSLKLLEYIFLFKLNTFLEPLRFAIKALSLLQCMYMLPCKLTWESIPLKIA